MKRERARERERVYVKWEAWGCPGGLGWGQENAHIAQASAVLSNSSTAQCVCLCVCVSET